MGRLDLPDPIRDEDIWLSAHDLCKTRLCVTKGCPNDADSDSVVCYECRRGGGIIGIRRALLEPVAKEDELVMRPGRNLLGADLSPRELEVLHCAAEGMTSKTTGRLLFKSTETIKTHRMKILAKLGAHSITEAVAIGFRIGLLE